jgi:hypothetical protein
MRFPLMLTSRHLAAITRLTSAHDAIIADQEKRLTLALDRLSKEELKVAALQRSSRAAVAIAYDLARDSNVSVRSRNMAARVLAALSGVLPAHTLPPSPTPDQVIKLVTRGGAAL